MKTITIAGNIGRDAVTRTTGNGDKVTSWSVAVEERNSQDKRTIWFDCNLWGARGEKLAQYLTKGSKVAIAGELSTREHDGKTYLTIRADQITLMGGGQDRQEQRQEQAPAQRNALDDEIPFTPEWR